MATFIANNQHNSHHDYLNHYLKGAVHFDLLSAFASLSGVKLIEDALTKLLESGNTARVIIGLNYEHTEPKLLDYFYGLKQKHRKLLVDCIVQINCGGFYQTSDTQNQPTVLLKVNDLLVYLVGNVE